MTRNWSYILLFVSFACRAAEPPEFLLNDAWQILGNPIDNLMTSTNYSIEEHSDFVDENEAVIHTQKWDVVYPNGVKIIVTTDNGIATGVQIRSQNVLIDRGVRVGNTLSEIKAAYPDSLFWSGSKKILSASLMLFAEDGNILFTFVDRELSSALSRGASYSIEDQRVAQLSLFSISFQDGNTYACVEQFPCPLFPARYSRP